MELSAGPVSRETRPRQTPDYPAEPIVSTENALRKGGEGGKRCLKSDYQPKFQGKEPNQRKARIELVARRKAGG